MQERHLISKYDMDAKLELFWYKLINREQELSEATLCYRVKDLAARNTHMDYESPTSSGAKVMKKFIKR